MIFFEVLLPILTIIGAGVWLKRRNSLPTSQLSKMTIFLFVPSFLFVHLYQSTISWLDLLKVLSILMVIQSAVAIPYFLFLKSLKVPGILTGSLLLAAIIFNAGNIGLPVTEMFYSVHQVTKLKDAMTIQVLAVMTSNLTIWFIGYGILSLSHGKRISSAFGFLRLPMIYALVLALIAREFKQHGMPLPAAIVMTLEQISKPTVPVMLLVLGGYLLKTSHSDREPTEGSDSQDNSPSMPAGHDSPSMPAGHVKWHMAVAVALKLTVLPLTAYGLSLAFGMWPWPGVQLVIATACPTAVNTFLLSMELKGDSQTAAACIFWSTILSGVTLLIILTLLTAAI